MSGQGPLTSMREPELRHWVRQIRCRSAAAAAQAARDLLQKPGFDRDARRQKFEVLALVLTSNTVLLIISINELHYKDADSMA